MSRPLPTPDELDDNPELAVLAVLDVTLEAARAALLSVHGELRGPEEPEHRGMLSPSLVARALIALGDALSSHVSIYHDALEKELLRQLDQSSRRDF